MERILPCSVARIGNSNGLGSGTAVMVKDPLPTLRSTFAFQKMSDFLIYDCQRGGDWVPLQPFAVGPPRTQPIYELWRESVDS